MGDRFPGGVISKTPPVVVAPVDGEGGSASGLWSLTEQLDLQKAGSWPQGVLPRELYAWGYNGFGRFGDGTTVSKSSPVQIGSLSNWEQVSAGTASAAITLTGQLYAWGRNNNGQVGDGTALDTSSPVQIGALTNWSQVSTGGNHTVAVKTDGTLWSWGGNSVGQLGDNTTASKSSPVQIGALTTWSQVSAGLSFTQPHTAAVKTDGTLWAWGRNNDGKLGDGSGSRRSSPVQIGALTNWAQAAAGYNHTAGVTTSGELYAWGRNNFGQLGGGTAASKSSPVQIGALTTWAQVATGHTHCAAVKIGGTLWAWGRNYNTGQLGDGTVVDKSSPVQVGLITTWSKVSAGGSNTAAAKTDKTLWAWGQNTAGQLGDGTTAPRSSPVQIGALTTWFRVSVGSNHTLSTTRG